MKLPPDLARAIGLDAWPDTAQARTALARGLSPAARVALLTWAHATLPQPPTLEAWAQLAGVAEQGLRRARRLDVGLRALPVAGRVRRDEATLKPSSIRRRRSEARARGEDVPRLTPGRNPRPRTEAEDAARAAAEKAKREKRRKKRAAATRAANARAKRGAT